MGILGMAVGRECFVLGEEQKSLFFGGGRGLNPEPCIYYALSIPSK